MKTMAVHTKEEIKRCKSLKEKYKKSYPKYILQQGNRKHQHEHHIPPGEGFRNADHSLNNSQPPTITAEARQLTIQSYRGIRGKHQERDKRSMHIIILTALFYIFLAILILS